MTIAFASRRVSVLVAAVWLAGCAATPGTGFATLAGGQLSAPAILPAGRLDETGRWKTSHDYRLALTGGQVSLAGLRVALQAPGAVAGGGGATLTIDPANPPPGYTFCHNTDCHAADGQVKSFDEIKAELAGGGVATPPSTVATLLAPGSQPLALTAETRLSLAGCEPHCFLPQGSLSKAALRLDRLVASGTVAPAAGGEARAFSLDLPLAGAAFTADVAAEVSLAGATGPKGATPAKGLALVGAFALTDKLFDGVPFERLLGGSTPLDLDADKEAAEVIAANFAKSKWAASLELRP